MVVLARLFLCFETGPLSSSPKKLVFEMIIVGFIVGERKLRMKNSTLNTWACEGIGFGVTDPHCFNGLGVTHYWFPLFSIQIIHIVFWYIYWNSMYRSKKSLWILLAFGLWESEDPSLAKKPFHQIFELCGSPTATRDAAAKPTELDFQWRSGGPRNAAGPPGGSP